MDTTLKRHTADKVTERPGLALVLALAIVMAVLPLAVAATAAASPRLP